jgi:hypothetical protein
MRVNNLWKSSNHIHGMFLEVSYKISDMDSKSCYLRWACRYYELHRGLNWNLESESCFRWRSVVSLVACRYAFLEILHHGRLGRISLWSRVCCRWHSVTFRTSKWARTRKFSSRHPIALHRQNVNASHRSKPQSLYCKISLKNFRISLDRYKCLSVEISEDRGAL